MIISGFKQGIIEQLHKFMYTNYSGDLMIVHKEINIKPNPSPLQVGWDKMLKDKGQLASIENDKNIRVMLKRLVIMGSVMGQDETKNIFATIIGCDFKKEEHYTLGTLLKFEKKIPPGDQGIYISKKIAQKLNLDIHDAIYLFFMSEAGIIPAKFKVAGIFTGKGFPGVVERLVYINYDELSKALMLSENQFSYALLMMKDQKKQEETVLRIKPLIQKSWKFVFPEVSGRFVLSQGKMYNFILLITMILVYLSIFLFVYSVLIVTIRNRFKEIGILLSLGIDRGKIFLLYTLEGFTLGFIPSLTGGIIGLLIVTIFTYLGIPAVNEMMRYVFASDMLYLKIDWLAFFYSILGISLIAFLGAIPPTLKVIKLEPTKALRDI